MRVTTTTLATFAAIALAGCSYHFPWCTKYRDCVAHYDAMFERPPTPFVEDIYGEGGSCWQSAENAELCEGICEMSVKGMRSNLEDAGMELGPCE